MEDHNSLRLKVHKVTGQLREAAPLQEFERGGNKNLSLKVAVEENEPSSACYASHSLSEKQKTLSLSQRVSHTQHTEKGTVVKEALQG